MIYKRETVRGIITYLKLINLTNNEKRLNKIEE